MNFQQPDFNQLNKPLSGQAGDKKRYISVAFFILSAVGIIYGASIYGIRANEIKVANKDKEETIWGKVANLFAVSSEKKMTLENDPDYTMPKPEDNRWDLLVLGIRGEDEIDQEVGALLTDTMMVISYDKETQRTSMVSIPRDLYVRIYGEKTDKINSAYEIGILRNNELGFTKKLISRITGVYIDSAIVVDFSSFEKIIEDLGGIDVVLDKPFTEAQQWGYEFSLPAGENHLDGQTALYYARSRFSSSDFDRAQRQQKIIMAIKDKVLALDLLSDPIKTLSILNTIRKNVNTDLAIWDAGSLLNLSRQFREADEKISRYVITTENLLYESHIQTDVGNIYVLLPNSGNLQGIKQMFQDIIK